MVRLPRNKKQTYRLNSRAQMWPSGLTLAMTLTLNFQGQIQNLLYLSHKWSDCQETKSKHIDWTLGLKCDHRVWLWPWPWPWIFKVKYRICCISAKIGQIASKRKANISIELQASNVTNGFELDLNLDLWILKVKCDLDLWPHRWPWPWIFKAKFWNSCISEWEGWLTLHKGGGSRSFMTMIMTIWWPRSGVWIYQVVTGVTSVVGVPLTHLVLLSNLYVNVSWFILSGGFYKVSVGPGLWLIGLNTVLWFSDDHEAEGVPDPDGQLAWLEEQLSAARLDRHKVR